MIDLDRVRAKGLTQENLEKWLSGNPLMWPRDSSDATSGENAESMRLQLWNRMRSRIQEGMNRNFSDYTVYRALDKAWDTPFRQVSSTLIADFVDQNPNDDAVYSQLKDWGLTGMITQQLDKTTGEPTGKKSFNVPMFFNIFVPLVKAYVTIRWAKIMNDLDLTPFFDFIYAKLTTPNKLKCQVVTDRVQVMSQQYGYYDVCKQAVMKMLHYSRCFQFPKESWHSEEQWKEADLVDVELKRKNPKGDPCSVGQEIKVVTREGLRYHHPHPTRTFCDLNHGAYTYNYDSGAEFAGYWQIRRYRDVINSNFWNKEQISIGPNSLIEDHRTFFSSVYSSCTLQVPTLPKAVTTPDGTTATAVASGTGPLDREKALSYLYYGTDHLDQGVLLTEYFEKLIPNQCGLGEYDCPIWMRFVVAGDNSTFMYAEPLPYCPVTYYGYDADESRTMNASLSLEVLPFQDQFGNILSQIILSAKQNLANLIFIDEDQVKTNVIEQLKNIGESLFRKLNIFTFSGKQSFRSQQRIETAVQSHTFPKANTAELMNVLKTILDVLERVLVMSSHEVAQAASHEQTREEVRNIAQSTTTRLQFTAKPVSIARESWKRQIYDGLMAFGDPFFYAHIPSDIPLSKEVLSQMGFTYADPDAHHGPMERYRRVRVDMKKTAIDLWMIASSRDGDDRPNDSQMAQVMGMLVKDLLANPMTAQGIGTEQAIAIANQIAQLAGLPRDFKLVNMSPQASPEEQQQAAQEQLKGIIAQVLPAVQQELMPVVQQVKQNTDNIDQLSQLLVSNRVPNPTNDLSAIPAIPGGNGAAHPGMVAAP